MKKFLFFASALAGLFLASSCQRENLEPVVNGGVTYEISLPDGPQTKGEAGYATYSLHYEVYKTAGNAEALADTPLLFDKTVEMTGNKTTVTLDLLNDQDYTVLFWANKKGTDYFDIADHRSDLKAVKVKQASSNNDDRDAFCAADQIVNHDAAQSKTVTLTRPFAQLNIATLVTTGDYDIVPQSSLVMLTSIPTAFNVFTGEPVGENTVVTYDVNIVPAGNLTVNGTEYKKVAMNYLLVPESNISVYYEINTANGTVKNTINNVPVKKNYRTNIIGNLLTSNATYTVEIKPGFEEGTYVGPEFVEQPAYDADTKTWTVTNAKELAWVSASVNGTLGLNTKSAETRKNFKGEIVKLAADIDLENKPWTPIGSVLGESRYTYVFAGTFDGNGKTIRNLKVDHADCAGLFGNMCGATIKNLTIDGFDLNSDHYAGAILGWGETGANPIVIENCKALNGNIRVNVVEISTGKHDLGDKAGAIVGFSHYGIYTGNEAQNVEIVGYRDLGGIVGYGNNTIVKNCKVIDVALRQDLSIDYKKNEENGSTPTTLDDYIGRKGGTCTIEGNEGTVTKNTDVTIEDTEEKTASEAFTEALANIVEGDVINVAADVEITLPYGLNAANAETITIAGSGESSVLAGTLNQTGNNQLPGNYAEGKHLVFKNLTYKTANNGYAGGFGHAASVTFINCTIIGQMYAHSNAPHYFYDCTIDPLTGYLYTYASDCVFEGCTFEASEGKALQVYEDGSTGENTVTIRDCAFIAAKQAATWDGKPVTGIDINSNGAIFNVTIDNCKTTGFPTGFNSGSDLYNIKGGADKVNLVIDGVYVNRAGYTQLADHPNIYVKDNNYFVFDKAGLADLNAYFAKNWCGNDTWNHEYHIGADIDATGFTWNSVWVNVGNNGNNGLVLNGNNHTISNMTIKGSMFTGTPNGGDAGTTPGYVKNIVIDNATVTGDHFTAVFWGNSYGELVYENVTVKNTEVTGACNVAVFLGATVIESPSTAVDQILFKNCSVENCTLVATGKEGQDPNGAAVYCSRAYGKTTLKFEGTNSIDEATTITNNNDLIGGKVYGYTLHHNGEWIGTGACDEFTNWYGLEPGVANVKDLAGIQAALADDEVEAVKIVSAIEIEGEEVTLDLNNKPITAVASDAFVANAGAKLTLKNGNVSSHEAAVRAIGGEVVIESGKYVQTGTAVGSTPATNRYCLDAREGGKITVNGGEFESKNGIINVNSGCELVINGGKFTSTIEKSMTRHFAYVGGKLTIKDGEFFGKANAGAGGCFLCGAASGAEILIEGGKFTSLWSTGKVNRIFEVYYGGTITVTGGLFNTNGGITSFVTENTDEATKAAYPYVAK